MRILSRPMFRYGGPIKEGIMSGMKNGGRAALVGNPVYPKTDGREHHWLNFALPALYAAGRYAVRPLVRYGANVLRRAPTVGKGGQKLLTAPGQSANYTPLRQVWDPNKATPTKFGKYLLDSPEGRLITGGAGWAGAAGKKALGAAKWVGKSPLTVGGLVWTGYQWLKPDGTPANENEIARAKGPPGGGDPGMTYTKPPVTKTAAEIAAEAKAARTKKLNKYLDTMGYDKAKKTAIGDALIDASAIVQQGTEEGGSLKHADWSKMINQAIQATSQRLKKPEQIREAVRLMMTKADIEKDMEDPQTKELRRLQIAGAEKALAGKTTAELIQERMLKGDYPSGKNLARLVSLNNPGANIKVIPSTGMDVDVDTIDYITKVVKKSHDEGNPFPPGNYVIKDRIIQVDETGNITPIPISALE